MNTYEFKVSYKNAQNKTVREAHLVRAANLGQAEALIIAHRQNFAGGEVTVTATKLSRVQRVVVSSAAGKWFLVKTQSTYEDERGRTRRAVEEYYVQAADICAACADAEGEVIKVALAPFLEFYEAAEPAITEAPAVAETPTAPQQSKPRLRFKSRKHRLRLKQKRQ